MKEWSFEGIPHLEGITNFGDNIEDEWLIVYLLYQLTRFDPDLVIKVDDTDGDFLLIEAADYLPKWCEPDNCDNRVFIYRQAVHIISPKYKPLEDGMPSIAEAIDLIRQNPGLTRAEDKIQLAITKRIDCFPQRIKEHQHKSHCFVPVGVAALLKHNPSLIALAVNAFYNRTPDDLKACQAMKYFPPESRVMRCITFTRCLYAQLMSQSYTPDVKVGWNLPSKSSRDFKAHDLGMKIASGFEILVSNAKPRSNDNNNKIDFNRDRRWLAFHQSLSKNQYFGNQLEGSAKYKELVRKAQNYFSEMVYNNERDQEVDCLESKASNILHTLQSLDIDEREFDNETKGLGKEDSDKWLTLDSDQLDAILTEKFCSKANTRNGSNISTQIPNTLKDFVFNEKSGLKGAEAPHPSRPNRIKFEDNSFTDALNTVLSFKVPHSDTGSSSSGMSDYSDDEESIDSDDDCYQHQLNGSQMKDSKDKIEEMKVYMEEMDKQLAQTSVGQSFGKTDENEGHEDNDLKAVDIDLNALTNILESYGSECGVPGPATALFATMGVKLPDNTDD